MSWQGYHTEPAAPAASAASGAASPATPAQLSTPTPSTVDVSMQDPTEVQSHKQILDSIRKLEAALESLPEGEEVEDVRAETRPIGKRLDGALARKLRSMIMGTASWHTGSMAHRRRAAPPTMERSSPMSAQQPPPSEAMEAWTRREYKFTGADAGTV